jgi:hypothetical protein
MAEFKGRMAGVGILLQDAGVIPGAPEYWLPWTDLSFTDTFEQQQNESAFNNIAHYNDQITTGVHGEGSITGKLWHKSLYYILCLIFGQRPAVADNNDGSYEYTFTMANNNQHLPATIAVNDPNNKVIYPNALLDSISLNWAPAEFSTAELSFISKRSQAIGQLTPAYIDDAEFKPDMLSLKLADDVAGLATANQATSITSVSLEVAKTVEGTQTSSSGKDFEILTNGDLEATLSIEKLYKDLTYRNMALNDTPKAVEFGFVDTINKAGADHDTSLLFTFPKVMLSSYEPSYGLSDTATESFEGMAMLSLAEGNLVTAKLVTKYQYTVPS